MKNSTIIAIANQKGGVGKTTTAFNLWAALALKHNKKVLLVDLDPQGNLSEYLKFKHNDGKPTITDLVMRVSAEPMLPAAEIKSAVRYNNNNDLYYIPADINLANAETYISSALARESILKRILIDELVSNFDYVLIDCLPSLGILFINALTAADKMIIPVQTQKFSLDGLSALRSLHMQIRQTINPDLSILGILPTMADKTTVSKKALAQLTEDSELHVFNAIIHRSVEAARSSESGHALCKIKCKLGDDYTALAEELTELLKTSI